MPYNHFKDEIIGDVDRISLGKFIFHMVVIGIIILIGIYLIK